MDRYISLFSGAGGLDLGLRQAGFFPGLMVDESKHAADTLRAYGFSSAVTQADVHDVLNSSLIKNLTATAPATLVAGQAPLVGGGTYGTVDPDSDHPQLLYRFLEAVEQARPTAFIMAGVSRMHTRPWAAVMQRCRTAARLLGYDTFTPTVNAGDYGTAQRKSKCFLIGMPKGCKPDISAAVKVPKASAGAALRAMAKSTTARDFPATSGIYLSPSPVLRNSPYSGELLTSSGRILDLSRPAPSIPGDLGGNKTPVIDLNQLRFGSVPWVEEYHRHLWTDHGAPLAVIPEGVLMRRLTMRECAALQGFPPDYPFRGPALIQFKLAGRAVPPQLGEAVGRAVMAGLK